MYDEKQSCVSLVQLVLVLSFHLRMIFCGGIRKKKKKKKPHSPHFFDSWSAQSVVIVEESQKKWCLAGGDEARNRPRKEEETHHKSILGAKKNSTTTNDRRGVTFVHLQQQNMPLRLNHCLPHTSYLGFFAAFSSNIFPSLLEIVYLIYSYHATTYVDQQTVIPSFWFRWWRPCFLLAGMLYDVGMLVYCIYTQDITAILLVVRILVVLYQLSDQYWLIKHWIPFFIKKEKRRFMFLRMFLVDCFYYLAIGSTSWTSSWQDRNFCKCLLH